MTDPKKEKVEEVFEIIELASNDITVLARAFDVINEVCQELSDPEIELAEMQEEPVIN